MGRLGLAYGIAFPTLLFLTSFFGTICFLTPLLPFVLLNPWFARRAFDPFLSLWILYAVALCEVMMGLKVKVTGKLPKVSDSQLVIMNHRTRLDWMFFWSYQIRFGSLGNMKISMKDSLKFIPGPGWAMQCAGFIFLKRQWQTDQRRLSSALRYYKMVDIHPQILLFPEGTDLTVKTMATSDKYAEKNCFNKYKKVLHPRTTGFCFLVEEMRKNNLLDSIVDITVAYPKTLAQAESDMLHGNFPDEIHFHVRTIPNSQLPGASHDVAAWCQRQWAEKESRLELFYEKKHFPLNEIQDELGNCDENRNCDETSVRFWMYGALVFWKLFLIVFIYGLFFVPYLWLYVLVSMFCFYIAGRRHGGLDNVMFSFED